jgi:hypothetical protein
LGGFRGYHSQRSRSPIGGDLAHYKTIRVGCDIAIYDFDGLFVDIRLSKSVTRITDSQTELSGKWEIFSRAGNTDPDVLPVSGWHNCKRVIAKKKTGFPWRHQEIPRHREEGLRQEIGKLENVFDETLAKRMAGTTRLELATSAVTVPRGTWELMIRNEPKWYALE